jgi:predicted DNA-binding transcriptional regulator AlpA
MSSSPFRPRSIPDLSAAIPSALEHFDKLPASAEVRQPVVEGLFGISASTVWRRVATGLLPQPVRRGGTTAWSVHELRRCLATSRE